MGSDAPRFVVSTNKGPFTAYRQRLMDIICPSGICHHGLVRCTGVAEEFDHLGDKPYEARRLNQAQRLRMYYREWLAAGGVVGKGVVGACASCNYARSGSRTGNGRPAYYRGKMRRLRDGRGQGYSKAAYVAWCRQQRDAGL